MSTENQLSVCEVYTGRARNNGHTPDNVWPYIEISGRNKFHQCN